MCGIAGLIYHNSDNIVESALLKSMINKIHHRGPDEKGQKIFGNVGIGMARLSIIDRSGGSQPISNEDESIWIVFNGEIYNFPELRINLEKKGHRFKTHSDTETIVHLYEEYGKECVQYLRGMFAFAIWDKNKEELYMFRDRLGIKPLHFYSKDSVFVFGSEIKSILCHPNINKTINPEALISYMGYGYVPEPDTMFKDVFKLPPGYFLVYKNGEYKLRKYWEVEYKVEKIQPEAYYIERVMDILEEAVRIRLISEVPLGAFLSGGVDSGVVVALMAKNMSEPVKTFSVGFSNQKFNELPYARMIAQQYGTDHHEEIVEPDALGIIENLVDQFDEPFADSSAIPTYYVSKVAKKHVTVTLSGDGGDELFGGYGRYRDSNFLNFTNRFPKYLNSFLFKRVGGLLPEWMPGKNFSRYASMNEDERYIWKMSKGISQIHSDIYSPELIAQVKTTDPSDIFYQYLQQMNGKDTVSRRQFLDTKTYLVGDILTKVDRMSMLVSLEARVPILDHKLVEFVATIPPQLKVKGMTTKYLLKKAAERLIPKEVIYRPKQGFAVPVNQWLKNEWKEMAYDLVLGERALKRNNFNNSFLKRIMFEHQNNIRDKSYLLWTLMMLELWYRQKID